MAPGKFHYLYGDLGVGKSHFMMNRMYLILQGHDGCGEWEVITNVFMYRKDENGTKVCDPDHVHHIDSLDEFFDKMVELSDTGRRVALFLDDFNRFYYEEGKDSLSRYLRQMILNRRKLGVLLFFTRPCRGCSWAWPPKAATGSKKYMRTGPTAATGTGYT